MVMKLKTAGVCYIFAALLLSIGLDGQITCGAKEMSASAVPEKPVPRLVVQTGHGLWVTSVAFSPDGRTLVSGSLDGTIKLWDVISGKELRTLSGNNGDVRAVAFSPDGQTVASGGWDKAIKLWDVVSGNHLRTLNGHNSWILSIVFSPDGRTLASGSEDNTIKLWDVASGNQLSTLIGHKGEVNSVSFSPNGHALVSGSEDGCIKLWDIVSGQVLLTLNGHVGAVKSVNYSPDGRSLASGGIDKTIKLWDVSDGKELRTLIGHSGDVKSVAFSPDGRTLASGSHDMSIKLWDVAAGKELHTLSGHSGDVRSVAFSPDGRTLASGSHDMSIKLWDVLSGHERFTLSDQAGWVTSVAFSSDGLIMASGNFDKSIKLWDIETGSQRGNLSGHGQAVDAVSFSPDGLSLASGSRDHSIKLWNVEPSVELSTLAGHEGSVSSVVFANKGHTLASGGGDNTIKLWNVFNGEETRTLIGHQEHVYSVAFSPDGQTLVSGSGDETIKLWNVMTGRQMKSWKAHGRGVHSVLFSPDGRTLVSGGEDKSIKLWDASTGHELRVLNGHSGTVYSVAESPDGHILASGSADDTIKIWDALSGNQLRTLSGHGSFVTSIAFFHEGDFLASGSIDKTIRLWRVSDGALLATLYSFTDGTWAVTDPEGRFDTADLEEIKGLHWVMPDDPLTPVPLEAFMKDYYEPRLLPRILNGEKFKPVRALMDLNRVQPEVKIVSVTSDSKDAERAIVEVEVVGAQKDYERDGKKVPMSTAANDLHLFRDGQLVGYVDGQVVKQGDKPYRKTFNIHLPSAMSGKEITFSAYAFNDDRVKSATARQTYQVPTSVVTKKGNAYLITMGVNQFDNPAWNLRFAANDARLMRKSLSTKLEKTGAYQNIVPLSLISDGDEHHADKALLHAILDRLSGKPASPLLKYLQGAEQLQPATPDDLVMITFSGHGYADGSGNFFLLTQDTGKGTDKHVDEDLLKRSISSEELSQWLKDVDAGDMTMIVDACQSAASVQGKDFKPGPMGSRGLGQLSFDKGMRILAASQADEYALENDQIKQGLLSFALVTNGIEGFEADNAPKDGKIMLDEWLRYGVSRVPGLAEEVKTGKVLVASKGVGERAAVLVSTSGTGKPRPAQQPALFDFAKKRRQVELAGQ